MMGIETIRQMNSERAMRAREEGLEPYVFDGVGEIDALTQFPFPHIGSHRPEGWSVREKTLFADSSGFGAPDEPALTPAQLKDELRRLVEAHGSDVGFAIIEAGQFQVHIGVFDRE